VIRIVEQGLGPAKTENLYKKRRWVMNGKRVSVAVMGVGLALMLGLTGCGLAPRAPRVDAKTANALPEATVTDFYDWYTDYVTDEESGGMRNAILDGALRGHAAVTPELADAKKAEVEAMTMGGYDPIMCAQDLPGELRIDDVVVSDGEASLTVHGVWNAGTEFESMSNIGVTLRQTEAGWQITRIECLPWS